MEGGLFCAGGGFEGFGYGVGERVSANFCSLGIWVYEVIWRRGEGTIADMVFVEGFEGRV